MFLQLVLLDLLGLIAVLGVELDDLLRYFMLLLHRRITRFNLKNIAHCCLLVGWKLLFGCVCVFFFKRFIASTLLI